MPPLPHLISSAPSKYNLYLANSLAATIIDEPDQHRLLTFHVPNLMSLFHCLGRNKISVQVQGTCLCFVTIRVFKVRSCQHHAQPPSWRTTPYRLYAAAYTIYSKLSSILKAVPPSATRRRAIPWWQGSTYHGYYTCTVYIVTLRLESVRSAFVWTTQSPPQLHKAPYNTAHNSLHIHTVFLKLVFPHKGGSTEATRWRTRVWHVSSSAPISMFVWQSANC
jgi:hypothetical protein